MTVPPQVNIAQRVLTGAQNFIPSGVRSLPWQLAPVLFPTLDASQVARRIFWSDYDHTMVGNLQFVATFDPTPIDVTRVYHHLYVGTQQDGSDKYFVEIVYTPANLIGNVMRIIIAQGDDPDRRDILSQQGAANTVWAPGRPFEIHPGGKLSITAKQNLTAGEKVRFGFIYEEIAAPVVADLKEVPVTVTEV